MKVSLIQMNSQDDKAANLEQAAQLVTAAVEVECPDFVILPELFTYMGDDVAGSRAAAETFPNGEAYNLMRGLAVRLGVTLHAGSMLENDDGNYYNTSVVFDRDGVELARYRKIHLFDIVTPGGESYRESDVMDRGADIVSYDEGGTRIGCTICYDIRFAELYRALADAGAAVITVPSAFTMETGKDHWEVLCRARAIETQTYVLAPNQVGKHPEGNEMRACFGHSMVVDPWGHVLARAQDKPGFISARLDFPYLESLRQGLPVHKHHVL